MQHLQDLKRLLDTLAGAGQWPGARGFIRRCDALDLLEVHLLELSTTPPASTPARTLRERALAMQDALEQANAAHVNQFRDGLRAGQLRGAALLRELQRHTSGEDDGYSHLDVLVAGLLDTGHVAGDAWTEMPPDMVAYQPTPARVVLELAERAGLGPRDTLVDVGSGLGVVPILVSAVTGARGVGVEIQPAFCQHARRCAHELNLAGVEFVCADARQADFSSGTAFYLYTPFKGTVLDEVLQRLHLQARQRSISLFIHGPHLEAALRQPWLALEEVPPTGGALSVFKSRAP